MTTATVAPVSGNAYAVLLAMFLLIAKPRKTVVRRPAPRWGRAS